MREMARALVLQLLLAGIAAVPTSTGELDQHVIALPDGDGVRHVHHAVRGQRRKAHRQRLRYLHLERRQACDDVVITDTDVNTASACTEIHTLTVRAPLSTSTHARLIHPRASPADELLRGHACVRLRRQRSAA